MAQLGMASSREAGQEKGAHPGNCRGVGTMAPWLCACPRTVGSLPPSSSRGHQARRAERLSHAEGRGTETTARAEAGGEASGSPGRTSRGPGGRGGASQLQHAHPERPPADAARHQHWATRPFDKVWTPRNPTQEQSQNGRFTGVEERNDRRVQGQQEKRPSAGTGRAGRWPGHAGAAM